MRSTTYDEDYTDIRAPAKPASKRFDLRQCAESPWQHVLRLDFLALKENKIVALRRKYFLGQFQEVQRNRQSHLREASNFETPHAEQDSRSQSLTEQFQSVVLALHSSRQDENKIRNSRSIGGG